MAAEKNNVSSNAWHNFAKGKEISKCKNDKPWYNQIGKVPAPPPFKKTCPYTSFPPLFFNFSDPPSWGGNINLLPPPLKRGVQTMKTNNNREVLFLTT